MAVINTDILSTTDRHSAKHPMGLFRTLAQMIALHRQRAALAQLDAHQLNDIGLTRAQAQAEAKRPFWDAPSTWTE